MKEEKEDFSKQDDMFFYAIVIFSTMVVLGGLILSMID